MDNARFVLCNATWFCCVSCYSRNFWGGIIKDRGRLFLYSVGALYIKYHLVELVQLLAPMNMSNFSYLVYVVGIGNMTLNIILGQATQNYYFSVVMKTQVEHYIRIFSSNFIFFTVFRSRLVHYIKMEHT